LNPTDYLSTADLATLYPVDGRIVPSQWYRACMRWRDQGQLRYPDHIQPVAGCRRYLLGRVCHILYSSRTLFAERVMYCNQPAILSILNFPRILQNA
jgi:hypothetical protein